jgi:hypothetical protein
VRILGVSTGELGSEVGVWVLCICINTLLQDVKFIHFLFLDEV